MWCRQSRFRGWLLLVFLSVSAGFSAFAAAADSREAPSEMGEPYVSPTNGLGSWIWEEKTLDNQSCLLWRTFDVPKAGRVNKARLVMTADNEFSLFLDGRELGHGAEWRELFIFDIAQLLPPGRHVLAVKCYNGSFSAGMLFGLRIDLADGQSIEVKSDPSWRIVPEGVKHGETRTDAQPNWPTASIKAPLGGNPWWTEPTAVNKMPPLQPIAVSFWKAAWFQVLLLTVCGGVILLSLWLMTQLALQQKERLLLQDERARIARDIHDDIGARMTQLVLYGEVAKSDLPPDSENRRQFDWICQEARGLLSTMDEILWAVNPQRDTLRDFSAYVCKYTREFLKPTPIQGLFEVAPDMAAAALDLPLRRSLLMAIKETLNNAVKHSAATQLRLQILWQGERLVVVVQDDGRGFDPARINPERHGLTNLAQRLNQLGGTCLVSSRPGQGCRVEFCVPLRRPRCHPWNWIWNRQKQLITINRTTRPAAGSEPAQARDRSQC